MYSIRLHGSREISLLSFQAVKAAYYQASLLDLLIIKPAYYSSLLSTQHVTDAYQAKML